MSQPYERKVAGATGVSAQVPVVDDALDVFASSPVATMPRYFVSSTIGTLVTGSVYGARARCTASGTYTKIRFMTGAGVPVYTDARAGVWDATTNALIVETANESAQFTAANLLLTLNLLAPINAVAGTDYFLALGLLGTTMGTLRGLPTSSSALMGLAPQLTKQRTTWAGGSHNGSALGAASGLMPWLELVA